MRTYTTILMAFLVYLTGTKGLAQSKKLLTEADFGRWNYFYQYALSPDAAWASYIVHTPNGKDTLFLRRTDLTSKEAIVGGSRGSFSPQSELFAFVRDSVLFYRNLATGMQDSVAGVSSYRFSKGGTFLLADRFEESELAVVDLSAGKRQAIGSVLSHALSPDSTAIAVIQRKDGRDILSVLRLGRSAQLLQIASSAAPLSGLAWNTKGDGLAFLEPAGEKKDGRQHHKLHYITFRKRTGAPILRRHASTALPIRYAVPASKLFFSKDDDRLFFDVTETPNSTPAERSTVWSSTARVLPPIQEENRHYLTCWNVGRDSFIPVTDAAHPVAIPATDGNHALVVDGSSYQPHFSYGGIFADLYLKDLSTGLKTRIAEKVVHDKDHIILSPGGSYICWFSQNNWWLYDIAASIDRCLTCSTEANFEDLENDRPGSKFPNAKPYWTTDEKRVLLASFYDIYAFDPKNGKCERITHGGRNKTKFRISDEALTTTVRDYFAMYQTKSCDTEKGIILKEVNTQTLEEGFSFYRSGEPLRHILSADDRVSTAVKVRDTYLYVLSDFDKSPELVIRHDSRSEGLVMQRSNEQQKEYHWGKPQLIHYEANGASLKGALYYPADYRPEKKYPMVVKIYERMSSLLHKYVRPTWQNSIGFNETLYANAGYFVLLPDIAYEIDRPGNAALRCTLAAVDKAMETASIDPKNIGLFGHSFGGFEASYIATQTERFKTVVSGSGWHDLVGTYLGTDESNISNIWRFDTQQLRLAAPYHSETFMDNSPILLAAGANVPLLLWTGADDLRVNWRNSTMMQTALWRLGKESTLLIYPSEGHVLLDPENQKDLTLKMLSWFGYYLKGGPKPEWIK